LNRAWSAVRIACRPSTRRTCEIVLSECALPAGSLDVGDRPPQRRTPSGRQRLPPGLPRVGPRRERRPPARAEFPIAVAARSPLRPI
jgi:hypothetical protein